MTWTVCQMNNEGKFGNDDGLRDECDICTSRGCEKYQECDYDEERENAKNIIESALESLEMVYNFHTELIDHNEIMWKAVRKISDAIKLL